MKGLKLTELEEGKVYVCRISDRKMLVVHDLPQPPQVNGNGLKMINDKKEYWGKYYNPQTGGFHFIDLIDYQLTVPGTTMQTQSGPVFSPSEDY